MRTRNHRRSRYLVALAAGSAAASVSAATPVDPASPDPHTVHCSVIAIDSHIDVPRDFATPAIDPGKDGKPQLTLPAMQRGCLDAVFFSVAVGQNERSPAHYQSAWWNSIRSRSRSPLPLRISSALRGRDDSQL